MASASLVFELIAKDKASKKLEDLGDAVDKTGDKASKIGDFFKKGLAGVALAAGAAGTALVAGLFEGIDRSASSDKLAAQLGLTANESKKLGAVAGKVFAGAYGESFGEVNQAVKLVVQNIGTDINSVDLQPLTESVFDLASAFDQDLNGVTRAAGDLLRNKLVPDAQTALDVITTGFQSGADRSEDFLDTINEYSPQFAKLGIEGPAAIGLISQGLEAGARNADLIGDAFKEFSIRAVDGSETTSKAFVALGLDADDFASRIAAGGPTAEKATGEVIKALNKISDPVKREAAGVALFGTQFEDLGQGVFAALDPAKAALTQTAGATKELGATLNDNAKTALEGYKRKAKDVFVTLINNEVIPTIQRNKDEIKNFAVDAGLAIVTLGEGFLLFAGEALDALAGTVRAMQAFSSFTFGFARGVLGALQSTFGWLPGFETTFRSAQISLDTFDKITRERTTSVANAFNATAGVARSSATAVGGLRTNIEALRPKEVKVDANVIGKDNIRDMRREIDNLRSKTVTVTTVMRTVTEGQRKVGKGSVPGFADGGILPRGLAVVGERGPELIASRGGDRVFSNDDSKRLLSGGNTYNYNVSTAATDAPGIAAFIKRLELLNA